MSEIGMLQQLKILIRLHSKHLAPIQLNCRAFLGEGYGSVLRGCRPNLETRLSCLRPGDRVGDRQERASEPN
jgi:hypothetical protein